MLFGRECWVQWNEILGSKLEWFFTLSRVKSRLDPFTKRGPISIYEFRNFAVLTLKLQNMVIVVP
jgi:hypothetical protein